MGTSPKRFIGLRDLLRTYAGLDNKKIQDGLSEHFARYFTILAVIRYWLGTEWVDRNLHPLTGHHIFRAASDETPELELRALRMRNIAENLFNLQYVDGFQELTQRMQAQDAEASMAELQVGRLLYMHDVDFSFIAPSRRSGADYDLEIRVPGHTICGETKCKISTSSLSVRSLANDIKKAAKEQLPRDRPGIIFLAFPPHWLQGPDRLVAEQQTMEAAAAALRSYSRVISVVLYTTPFSHDGTMAEEGHEFLEVPNPVHKFQPASPHFHPLLRYRPTATYWDGMPAKWIRLHQLPCGGLGEYRHERYDPREAERRPDIALRAAFWPDGRRS
jgi:hypothetical protein